MPRNSRNRHRYGRGVDTPDLDLAPLVARTLLFLANSPRGASRIDILTAMNLQPPPWPLLRKALERTGEIVSVGRGPGLRHVHISWAESIPMSAQPAQDTDRTEKLAQARQALKDVLLEKGVIDSTDAQHATGLRADPVRRLLLEFVDRREVERSGQKRSTRYRWIG